MVLDKFTLPRRYLPAAVSLFPELPRHAGIAVMASSFGQMLSSFCLFDNLHILEFCANLGFEELSRIEEETHGGKGTEHVKQNPAVVRESSSTSQEFYA